MHSGGSGKATVVLGKYRPDEEKVQERIKIAVRLQNPVVDQLPAFIAANREYDDIVVAKAGSGAGKTLTICGAGPSLRDATLGTDDVWACNSALPYLFWKGERVTHGVGIDQTPGLLREWESAPDVPYLLASSVDPVLVNHLRCANRSVTFFHNCVGVADEIPLYKQWPSTFMVTAGYSVVSRAVNLAFWMGYERIDVVGADCEFGDDDLAHANGESATDAYGRPMVYEYTYPDRTKVSRTRMDMLMDAVYLARLARDHDRIRLVGDTLPAYLQHKPDEFLSQVCRQLSPDEALALT
jgi:hypothetical protein